MLCMWTCSVHALNATLQTRGCPVLGSVGMGHVSIPCSAALNMCPPVPLCLLLVGASRGLGWVHPALRRSVRPGVLVYIVGISVTSRLPCF